MWFVVQSQRFGHNKCPFFLQKVRYLTGYLGYKELLCPQDKYHPSSLLVFIFVARVALIAVVKLFGEQNNEISSWGKE